MNHVPRYDGKEVDPAGLKPNLAKFANNCMLELWLQSPLKNKILIGTHTLDCAGYLRSQRYTDERTGKYDGVHLYGKAGKEAYSESVLNNLLSSFQTQDKADGRGNESFHKKCPQAQYRRQHEGRFKYQGRRQQVNRQQNVNKRRHVNRGQSDNLQSENVKGQYRTYSSVTAGNGPVKTHNRFTTLGN